MKAEARNAAIFGRTGNFAAEEIGAPAFFLLAPVALATLLVAIVVLLTMVPTPAAAADCPNEIRRQEQGVLGLQLPNCRAYEMVSPGTFPQQWTEGGSRGARSSLDGNRFAYFEFYPGTDFDNSSLFYLSQRGSSGWTPETSTPQQLPAGNYMYQCDPQVFYSSDFSYNILQSGYHQWYEDTKGGCKLNEVVIDPRENREYRNLYLHDNTTGEYELLSLYPETAAPSNSELQGFTPDLDTVVFAAMSTKLTADDPLGLNFYVASGGEIRLLGYLPDGTPFAGTEKVGIGDPAKLDGGESPVQLNAKLVGSTDYSIDSGSVHPAALKGSGDMGGASLRRSISEDGSRIFFYAGGNLYMRVNPAQPQSAVVAGLCTEPEKACTIQIDKSQGPGTSGGGRMSFASADGSKVFFTSAKKLTVDSTATTGKEDLYEYDVETETLTDLTVNVGEPANVQNVTWATPSGDYAFFVAQAALAPGALPGKCSEYFEGYFCNLYMVHDGEVTFIASLLNDDSTSWGYDHPPCYGCNGGQVTRGSYGVGDMVSSPNGQYFAFESSASLTAYDSEGAPELYLFDTGTKQLDCVSCPVTGQGGEGVWQWSVQNIDGAQAYGPVTRVTDNGRIFFETEDQLVAADTNDAVDVYQYEAGERWLLSGGKSENNAHFQDATADGSNAFFVTAEPLLPGDTDGASSIYDARIDGGFPEPPPLPACEGEACRGQGSTPGEAPAAGTGSFSGPGNQMQAHKRDCSTLSKRALSLSRQAKALRRKSRGAASPATARALRERAAKLAAKGKRVSKKAKDCRRANRRAGK